MDILTVCAPMPPGGTELQCETKPPTSQSVGGGQGASLDQMQALSFENGGQIGRLDAAQKLPTTMELFHEVLSKQIVKERALDKRMASASGVAGTEGTGESLQDFATGVEELMALQTAYHEKSIGSQMILSAGKSADGFFKTLMRSQ